MAGKFATARLTLTVSGVEVGDDHRLAQMVSRHLRGLPGFALSEVDLTVTSRGSTLYVEVATHGVMEELPDAPAHVIRSGKHRGKLVGEVPTEYAVWLASHGADPLDRLAAKEWLRK